MSPLVKRLSAALAVVLLLAGAAGLLITRRVEQSLADAAATRRQQILDLRLENLRLRREAASAGQATPTSAPTRGTPTRIEQLRAATVVLAEGQMGPFAWSRGQGNSLEDELAELAAVLGLTPAQQEALMAAARQTRDEVVSTTLLLARVNLNENPAPSDEAKDADPGSQLNDRIELAGNPAGKIAVLGQEYSRRAAADGLRELYIEIPDTPVNRASVDRMQAAFADIMGADVYSFYQASGAARTIESFYDDVGLQAHSYSIISHPTGTLSETQRRLMEARDAIIARGGTPPAALTNQLTVNSAGEVYYEIRHLRSQLTWHDTPTRREGVPSVISPNFGPREGIWTGSPTPISPAPTREELESVLGPLGALLPEEF